MRKIIGITALTLAVLATACSGDDKAAQEQAEKARQDSIRAAHVADSLAKVAADSIQLVEMKAKNDSLRAIRHAQDSATIASLAGLFKVTDKDFVATTGILYTPKSAPTSLFTEAFYFTFRRFENSANGLTLCYQTKVKEGSESLTKIVVKIDGKDYEIDNFSDQDIELTGAYNYTVYEHGKCTSLPRELLQALPEAEAVKVNYSSPNFESSVKLTAKQIKALKDAVALYQAFGGE